MNLWLSPNRLRVGGGESVPVDAAVNDTVWLARVYLLKAD